MPGLKAAILPVTPFQQNCTILWDEETKRGAVVDPGGDVERILAALHELGVTAEKILLTHGHIDHAGGAADLRAALEREGDAAVPIEGPDQRDAFLLEGLTEQGRTFGVEGAKRVQPTRWLVEGDTVSIGGHEFSVRHCPGHTPGHIVLINAAHGLALVGDVIFRGSVGRTDFPYGDHEALIASIRDKILTLPDETVFICGHGPGSSVGAERRGNPFVQ
jgi:hydroxyacylglutathione hydrolase